MSSFRTTIKKLIPTNFFKKIEPLGHGTEAWFYALGQGFPGKKLRIIGVTGTNGKTTTSAMIHEMLVSAGYKVGLMTTAMYGIDHDLTANPEHMTTVSAKKLQQRLKAFQQANVDFVVLETTSHALAQHRVAGVQYEIAVGTNITHEHLDYHGTFEKYAAAKRLMFEDAAKHPQGFGVFNADDQESRVFANVVPQFASYGIKAGDIRASDIQQTADESTFSATHGANAYQIRCFIPGQFNIYNSLAAVAVGEHLGLSKEQIEQGIAALKFVPGRMQVINAGQPYRAVVDFAHTPDSFELLLSDMRKQTPGKLVVLFGSAGRRDKEKRFSQGEIAAKYADELILTEEDDRDISGDLILSQIAEGAARSGKTEANGVFKILSRPDAIKFAMTRVAGKDDTVAFLGKGHEATIERAISSGGTKDPENPWEIHPWNEVETVMNAIKNQ